MSKIFRAASPPADDAEPSRIAVVGAGVAGAACAAELLRAGFDVTVFDKSRGVGGRLATRRAEWVDAAGARHPVSFDHGCAGFTAIRPAFRSAVDRVVASGGATRWRQRVHGQWPTAGAQDVVVPVPDMPAFCRHVLNGVPLRLGETVCGLERDRHGWWLRLVDTEADGPFEHVVLAMPATQAAALLRPHRAPWAEALADVRMSPCWTLMAVTNHLDWPWDAARIEHGELAWVARQDRVPGRVAGAAVPWVAHTTAAWSLQHLEDDPEQVCQVLSAALGRLLTGAAPPAWHHRGVRRWRYATRAEPGHAGPDHWWDTGDGLGVCGDAFGEGSVEAAWCSGQALARALMGSVDASPATAALRSVEPEDEPWDAAEPQLAGHGRPVPVTARGPAVSLQARP